MTLATRRDGFTIVELMVAIGIGVFVLTAAMNLTMRSTRLSQNSADTTRLTALQSSLTRTLTEDLRVTHDVSNASPAGAPASARCYLLNTYSQEVYYCTGTEISLLRAEAPKASGTSVPIFTPIASQGVLLSISSTPSRYDVEVSLPSQDARFPNASHRFTFHVTPRVR